MVERLPDNFYIPTEIPGTTEALLRQGLKQDEIQDGAILRRITEIFFFRATALVETNRNNPDYPKNWEGVESVTFPTSLHGEVALFVDRIPEGDNGPRQETTRIAGVNGYTYEIRRDRDGPEEEFRLEDGVAIPYPLPQETRMAIHAALLEGFTAPQRSA